MRRDEPHIRATTLNLYDIVDKCRQHRVIGHSEIVLYCIIIALKNMGYQLHPGLLSLLSDVRRECFSRTENVIVEPLESLLWDLIPTTSEISDIRMIGNYGCIIYQEINHDTL